MKPIQTAADSSIHYINPDETTYGPCGICGEAAVLRFRDDSTGTRFGHCCVGPALTAQAVLNFKASVRSIATVVVSIFLALLVVGCSNEAPAQLMKCEIVAVYQIKTGEWETCLKLEDGTRSLWPGHKLGGEGDKFHIWKRGAMSWLQDPN